MADQGPDRRRRTLLGSIAAAMGGLAGCEGGGSESTGGAPTDGATPPRPGTRGVPAQPHPAAASGGATLSPDALSVGADPTERPVISTGDRRVHVPEDYDTIQAAVNTIPLFVRHGLTIEIAPGTYDEDVVVPAFVSTEPVTMDRDGGYVNVAGDEGNPTSVQVGSMYVAGPTGRLPLAILGMTFLRQNPYDDEKTALAFYGGGEHYVRNVVIGQGSFSVVNGILAYAAHVHVDLVDFGDSVTRNGYSVKHGGFLMEQKTRETPSRGQVGSYAYDPEEGTIFFRGESSSLGGNAGLVKTDSVMNGFAFDTERGLLHNVSGFPGGVAASGGPVRDAGGVGHAPRTAPTAAELGPDHGAAMTYAASGEGDHPAGAMVYAAYDADADRVETTVLADPLSPGQG